MRRQSSITFTGVNSGTPLNGGLSGKYLQTFAYYTIKDRLPVILTKVIDQLSKDKEEIMNKYGTEAEEDIKTIVGKISKLKNELQTNKLLVEFDADSKDIPDWNKALKELEGDEPVCWYLSPWLFIETYMYRRLWEMFELSKVMTAFDPFKKQKEEALEVSLYQLKPVANLITVESMTIKERIINAIKISLWSNRCDLSLSNGTVLGESGTLVDQIKEFDPFILADDSEKTFEILTKNSQSKIVDIVHDNASFELFCDLSLADILISTGVASTVRLRVKCMPWYVSDATVADLNHLLDRLGEIGLQDVSQRWRNFLATGVFKVIEDKFWTLPHPYSRLKTEDPDLYDSLSEAFLVIFKGDLNYRKLLGDINWSFSDKFSDVLSDFKPTNILALRTIKADLVCGLPPGRTEGIFQKEPLWMRSGEYSIIQLSEASN